MTGKRRRVALDLAGLSGHEELWHFAGTAKRAPAVEAWLGGEPVELRALARHWFAVMRDCGDDVRELLHDGCPVACVDDVPFAYVNSFRGHVNVGFFQGAALDDPAGLLAGSGKRMRHVKVVPRGEVNAAALRELIAAAYTHAKARVSAERASNEPVE